MSKTDVQVQQENTIKKSLVEQIMDETVSLASGHSEFDDETISKLDKLIQDGDIKKRQEVEKLLS